MFIRRIKALQLAVGITLAVFGAACGGGRTNATPVEEEWADAGGVTSTAPPDAGAELPKPKPSGVLEVTQPSAPLLVAPGVHVATAWRFTGDWALARADVFADRDGDLTTTLDQVEVALDRPMADAGIGSVTWNTTGVPLGMYQVIVRVRTGDGTVIAGSPHAVEITAPTVTVENLAPNERLRHPLALLNGTALPTLSNVIAETGGTSREWPASAGRFKALVPLAPGPNVVTLTAAGVQHRLELEYQPIDNIRFVRLVYVVAADGDGRFDAPAGEPNDVESATRRIATAAELMQTFTAEKLHVEGLGRRTFRLQRDASGRPIVEIFKTSLTTEQARGMDGLSLWKHFYGELGALPDRAASIDVVIMSMTHYDPVQKKALAHTALGGGRLGLFGSGTLHTWAESLDEVVSRFSDDRLIVTTQLFDDSAYRGTYWANYATGIGATLHELGHCLSLPHPANGKGIMSREFDHFNRAFMVREPQSKVSSSIDPVLQAHEIGWDRSAAVRLRFHRWLEPDVRTYQSNAAPTISEDAVDVTIAASSGVRHVAWHVDGKVAGHEEYLTEAPPTVTVSKASLKVRFPGETSVRATSIDDEGNIGERDVLLQ